MSQTVAVGHRLRFLDALRGLASGYVVLFHLRYVGGVKAPASLSTFVSLGGTGVMLFFVVSCFSLFYTMPARFKQSRPFFAFYVHRFFRIAPLFYLWLVIETVLNHSLYHFPTLRSQFLESIFFVFNLAPGSQSGIVMASWTIGVEMLFYLIFPVVYLVTKSITHALALAVGSGLLYFACVFVSSRLPISIASSSSYASWIFLKDLPVFAFGAVCFFIVRQNLLSRGDGNRDRAMGALLIMFGLYVMVARGAGWINDGMFGGHPYIWPGIGYSLVLVGLSLNPLKLIVNWFTTFLGKISYSLYLAHAPIILLFAHYNVYGRIVDRLGQHGGYVASLLLTLTVAISVAYVTYRLVELPSIKLGKLFFAHAVSWPIVRPAAKSGVYRRHRRSSVGDPVDSDSDSIQPSSRGRVPDPDPERASRETAVISGLGVQGSIRDDPRLQDDAR